ncbi:MAG: regulatory protein GemA [Solidesulfovibrio sp. DCME]|uniref:regulatory protein GemA n=1 Tax=Solidesulfovibrio sp. DCME TaxID=3447380 RepID=UPI003D0BEB28
MGKAPTPGQIKKLHALRRALGLDEPTYRAVLERYGAASSLNLSPRALARCIEQLEQDAVAAGVWQARGGAPAPRKRPGAASDAQLRLVAALWKQVSRQETEAARKAALEKFTVRITGKPKLAWCGQRDVEKLIAALEGMGAKRE